MVNDASNTQSNSMVLARDVQELQGPNFLSDTNINRFFRHLSNLVGGGASIQFVDVATTQLIAHCPFLSHERIDLTSLDIGLFAVNDNENHEAVGGTHWSLLVFDGTQQPPRFVHHDSSGGRNIEATNRLATSLRRLYPGMEEDVVQAPTPQQKNGWDYGVYVMAIARAIMCWWSEGAIDSWVDRLLTEVDSQLREDLVRLLMGEIEFDDLV
ncbi:NEDD8-specific protease 1-like [Aegilops tauschii subsp. strangulata]|uniref:Sentrin-specific protease 8 n=1 Tax=Aegilops tauschii TaxID=37682 RepID=R7VZE4_AEGTA|nr:NEDD8-specific protease 1-like [Aegilops tauschii subsp. strangulata]